MVVRVQSEGGGEIFGCLGEIISSIRQDAQALERGGIFWLDGQRLFVIPLRGFIFPRPLGIDALTDVGTEDDGVLA